MGLAPLMLAVTCLLVVRNQRILTAWNARQEDNARRAAAGLPPKTRKRRRKTLASLTAPPPPRPAAHRRPPDSTRHERELPAQQDDSGSTPRTSPGHTQRGQPEHRPHTSTGTGPQQARMSDPNVNIGPTET